jgi:hypothetical protein
MEEALIALVSELIDISPSLITAIEALAAQKRQQYASVLASVQAQDAANVAALKATLKP